MGIQPTASRTDLLLECQYAFGKDVEVYDPPGEPARYGSAFHFVLADLLTGWSLEVAGAALSSPNAPWGGPRRSMRRSRRGGFRPPGRPNFRCM